MSPKAAQSIPIQINDHVKFTSPLKKRAIPIIDGMKIIASAMGYAVANAFSNAETFGSNEYAMYILGMDMAMEMTIAVIIIFFVIAFLTGFK